MITVEARGRDDERLFMQFSTPQNVYCNISAAKSFANVLFIGAELAKTRKMIKTWSCEVKCSGSCLVNVCRNDRIYSFYLKLWLVLKCGVSRQSFLNSATYFLIVLL